MKCLTHYTIFLEVMDINNDGYLDIFGVGNIYEAEVETIKYDASKGYILLGNKEGKFEYLSDTSYLSNKEAKVVKKIVINNSLHCIILNKNNQITVLKIPNAKL